MVKPATFDGYSDHYTRDCERVRSSPLVVCGGQFRQAAFSACQP